MSQHPALTDRDFDVPGSSRGLIEVFKYRYLLRLLLKKGVSTRYHGSVLGWVWSYIRPAAQFLMYYLVIGVILGADRGMELFPVYLFCGIVAVNLFSESLRNSTSAMVDNKSLIRKIFLPRELFPIAAVGVAVIHFLPQTLLLLAVVLILGWTIGWIQVAAFVLGMLIIIIFALGLGLFFGAINVAYRDARNFVDIILMFATWASPVLYSFELVKERAPDWLYQIYMLNPMTVGIELFHEAFWVPIVTDPVRPDVLPMNILWGFLIAIGTFVIGQFVFRKLEGSFAQLL